MASERPPGGAGGTFPRIWVPEEAAETLGPPSQFRFHRGKARRLQLPGVLRVQTDNHSENKVEAAAAR